MTLLDDGRKPMILIPRWDLVCTLLFAAAGGVVFGFCIGINF